MLVATSDGEFDDIDDVFFRKNLKSATSADLLPYTKTMPAF